MIDSDICGFTLLLDKATVLALNGREHYAMNSKSSFKNLTFLIGLSWLLYGALTYGYPDWDVGVSLLMATATYFTADKVVMAIRNRQWRRWPMMLFYTWFAVDGSYVGYWFCRDRHVLLMMRDAQWPTSLCLFLICGVIWSINLPAVHQQFRKLIVRAR